MKIVKPKKLSPGDLIGIISPASNPENLELLDKNISYFEKLGYRIKLGKNIYSEDGFYAGNITERLDDIHTMFKDKDVKAIFCTRGGYGSTKLLDKLNYSLIKKNPKILVGFSDLTAVQLAILKKTGLITFSGPMPAVNDFSKFDKDAEENFWEIMTKSKKIGKIQNPSKENFYSLNKSSAEGKLIGGNLSILISLMGTTFEPDFKDKILLIEEINEPPYKIDRMFNQLRLAKVFNKIKGVIFGRFVDCYENKTSKRSLNLNEIIIEYFQGMKIPVIYNLKHGHISQTITLPLGINCKVNSSRGFVEFTESAVT